MMLLSLNRFFAVVPAVVGWAWLNKAKLHYDTASYTIQIIFAVTVGMFWAFALNVLGDCPIVSQSVIQ